MSVALPKPGLHHPFLVLLYRLTVHMVFIKINKYKNNLLILAELLTASETGKWCWCSFRVCYHTVTLNWSLSLHPLLTSWTSLEQKNSSDTTPGLTPDLPRRLYSTIPEVTPAPLHAGDSHLWQPMPLMSSKWPHSNIMHRSCSPGGSHYFATMPWMVELSHNTMHRDWWSMKSHSAKLVIKLYSIVYDMAEWYTSPV